ncbi:MAG: DUF4138 domain-containing protein [Chitinophagaceae bacterium]|nr:MAG: DUF4138 domain-containing protein [Chitinophagaceae bacterium]
MKRLISILFFAALVKFSFAQQTAYVSRDKVTALFFDAPVQIVGNVPAGIEVKQKGNGVVTLKALTANLAAGQLNVQNVTTQKTYHIPVAFSYGKAGRRLDFGESRTFISVIKTPEVSYSAISRQLTSGKRKAVIDKEKTGGVKAWVNRLSTAGNKIYFRLDIRNRSNLPYDIDFIRFYIRDLKTVARMATHEQEIVPAFTTLEKRTTVVKSKEVADVFAFSRFSLADDQALNVEVYERNGNRHLYLQIKQKDLNDLETINPVQQQPVNAIAVNTL